jgi:hypothetical protein
MLATLEVEKVGTSLMPLQWSVQNRALIVETVFNGGFFVKTQRIFRKENFRTSAST